jgi:hypothetical protein
MTGREIKLWLSIGVVVAAGLIYNTAVPYFTRMEEQRASPGNWDQAIRLLRAEDNIRIRNRAVRERYQQLQQRFVLLKDQTTAELDVLEIIEDIAANCGLRIKLKNTVQLSPDEIGVALEGTTGSEMFYRFLQQLTEAPIGLKIKTLQLHGTPEKRELDYQVVVSALLVK